MLPSPIEDGSDRHRLSAPPCASKRLDRLDISLLVEHCLAGNTAAWNELIRRYDTLLYRFARSLCGNPTDAEDIKAQVLLRLYQSLSTFHTGASFTAWLYRIVRNTYIDLCVRNPHRGLVSLEETRRVGEPAGGQDLRNTASSPEEICLANEKFHHLAREVRHLPRHQRQALQMYLQGLGYAQIARMTEVSIGTVKSRISRARRTLTQRLSSLR